MQEVGPTHEQVHQLAQVLASRYPDLGAALALDSTLRAYDALSVFGLTDDEDAFTLWRTIAEREVRLRLGIEREDARLDPQYHPPRR